MVRCTLLFVVVYVVLFVACGCPYCGCMRSALFKVCCCLMFVVCCLLFADCCLLFVTVVVAVVR